MKYFLLKIYVSIVVANTGLATVMLQRLNLYIKENKHSIFTE